MEGLTLGLGIIRLELMTSTMSRWHSTAELYPFPTFIWKENWLMNNNLPKGRETQHHYPTIFSRTTWRQTFLLFTLLRKERMRKIGYYSEWILSKIGFPTDLNHNIWSRKISNILPISIKQVWHEHVKYFVKHIWSDLALVRAERTKDWLEEQGEQDRVKIIQRWYGSKIYSCTQDITVFEK